MLTEPPIAPPSSLATKKEVAEYRLLLAKRDQENWEAFRATLTAYAVGGAALAGVMIYLVWYST